MNPSNANEKINIPSPGPPKVPMVFRVGVVGHRKDRLRNADQTALEARLGWLLKTISSAVQASYSEHRDLYDGSPPVLRALSPLAEGTDQIFAIQALAHEYKLTAVLPFDRNEYERDFPKGNAEPGSLEGYLDLLGKADTVFELDGTRVEESRAYGIAGRVVLNQADVLIVVWDGMRQHLHGGTEELLDAAIEEKVPVLLVLAQAPHHWRLIDKPIRQLESLDEHQRLSFDSSTPVEDLTKLIRRSTDLHQPPSDAHDHNKEQHGHELPVEVPRHGLNKFYGETQRKWKWAIAWKMFRDFVGDGKRALPTFQVPLYEEAVKSDWPNDQRTPVSQMIDRLRPFFAWPDKLADMYADRYRSAFVATFGCATFAVAMALGSILFDIPHHKQHSNQSATKAVHPSGEHDTNEHEPVHQANEFSYQEVALKFFAISEFLTILLIIGVVAYGRYGHWHKNWLDYRLLAEMIRHQRLVATLGGDPATPNIPSHLASYGDPGVTWMAWYSRALERSLGVPNARVDVPYLQECLHDLHDQIGGPNGQIGFHLATYERSERIENRLHLGEVSLFVATLVCSFLHIVEPIPDIIRSNILTFCCGFFPVFGAALAGINNQGEFRRIALRSKSMHGRLKRLSEQIKSMQTLLASIAEKQTDGTPPRKPPRQLSAEISKLASEAARMMVTEVLDYRVIFQDRPLNTT